MTVSLTDQDAEVIFYALETHAMLATIDMEDINRMLILLETAYATMCGAMGLPKRAPGDPNGSTAPPAID